MPRGIPKKKSLDVTMDHALSMAKQDPNLENVDGEFLHKMRIIQEDTEVKKLLKVVDSYYIIQNSKVIKCSRKANGNLHRVFVCRDDKKNKDFVNSLKQKGEVRVS